MGDSGLNIQLRDAPLRVDDLVRGERTSVNFGGDWQQQPAIAELRNSNAATNACPLSKLA
jgi:hypothetical protein